MLACVVWARWIRKERIKTREIWQKFGKTQRNWNKFGKNQQKLAILFGTLFALIDSVPRTINYCQDCLDIIESGIMSYRLKL